MNDEYIVLAYSIAKMYGGDYDEALDIVKRTMERNCVDGKYDYIKICVDSKTIAYARSFEKCKRR